MDPAQTIASEMAVDELSILLQPLNFWCSKMPNKRKKVSFTAPLASSGIATQNSFSVLSVVTADTLSAATPNNSLPLNTGALPPDNEPTSSAGTPPPSKKRREGSPPPATGASSTKGKLESQIHTLALRRATELLAATRAAEALAAAIDSTIGSLNGLAKTQGKKITHQLNKVLQARLTPEGAPP